MAKISDNKYLPLVRTENYVEYEPWHNVVHCVTIHLLQTLRTLHYNWPDLILCTRPTAILNNTNRNANTI